MVAGPWRCVALVRGPTANLTKPEDKPFDFRGLTDMGAQDYNVPKQDMARKGSYTPARTNGLRT